MLRRHFMTNSVEKEDYVITYYADEKILIPGIKYYSVAYTHIKNIYMDLSNKLNFKILRSEYNANTGIGKWYIKLLNNIDDLKIACTAYDFIYDYDSGGGGFHPIFMIYGLDFNDDAGIGSEYDKRGKITKIVIPNGIEQTILLCTPIRTYNNDYTRIFDAVNSLQEIILPNTIKIIGNSTFMGCKIPIITIPPYVEEIHNSAFAFTESIIELPFIPPKIKDLNERIYLFGEDDSLIKAEDSIKSKFKCYPLSMDLYLQNEDWQTYKDLFDGYRTDADIIVDGFIDSHAYNKKDTYNIDNIGEISVCILPKFEYYAEFAKIYGDSIKKLYINSDCMIRHNSKYHINKCIEELYLLSGKHEITAYCYPYGKTSPDITTDIQKIYYNLEYVAVRFYLFPVYNSCVFLIKNINDLEFGNNVRYIPEHFICVENLSNNEILDFDFRNLESLGEYFIQKYDLYNTNNITMNMKFSNKIKYIGFNSLLQNTSYNIYINNINDIAKIYNNAGIGNILSNDGKINIYINDVLLENGELIIDVLNNPLFYNIQLPNVDIKLSDNVKSLPNNCFHLSNIKSIDLNKVESIGEKCFNYLYKHIDIIIPNTVKYIGSDAFSVQDQNNNPKLNITIEDIDALHYVGVNAFKYTNIEETLIEDVVYIGKTLYKINSTTITNIVCKEGIEYVNLNSIPNSVETITLPNSIKEIYFNNKVYISNQFYINKNSNFYMNCDYGTIYINNYCIGYKVVNNTDAISLKNETELIAQCSLANAVINIENGLPTNLKYINSGAFNNATFNVSNRDLILPENLEIIDDGAFRATKYKINGNDFTSTINIIANNKLRYIGNYAFNNTYVNTLDLSNSVIENLNYCISGNEYLYTLKLPKTIKKITYKDFYKLYNLQNIYYSGTIEEWNAIEKDTKYWYLNTIIKKIICVDGEITFF